MTTTINPKLISPSGSAGDLATIVSGNVAFAAPASPNISAIGTTFSSYVSNVTSYALTTTMANAIVFPPDTNYRYVVDSILISNADTTGLSNVAISSNISFSGGSEVIHANVIPIGYRSSLELLKKPQVFNPGDALRLQSINTSSMYATITFQRILSNAYVGSGTLLANTANSNLYVSTNYPTVIESIRVVNTANANAGITVKWVDSSGIIKTYFTYELIIPTNCVVELCENVKRLNANDVISVYPSYPNIIGMFISGKKIV